MATHMLMNYDGNMDEKKGVKREKTNGGKSCGFRAMKGFDSRRQRRGALSVYGTDTNLAILGRRRDMGMKMMMSCAGRFLKCGT